MKLPDNTIIAVTTLYDELLQPDALGNQAVWLAKGGYTLANWEDLETDLRQLLATEAIRVRSDEAGDYYEINDSLQNLPVKTLWYWAKGEDAPRFVTLLPIA